MFYWISKMWILLFFFFFCSRIPLNEANKASDLFTAVDTAISDAVPSFDVENFKLIAQSFGPIGNYISGLINAKQTYDYQGKVQLKLDTLSYKLDRMRDEVKLQTDQLSQVMSELSFSQMIEVPLVKFMNDAMTNPIRANVKDFKRECVLRNPMTIATDLEIYMLGEKTNPFKFSMEADQLKSNKTYQLWLLRTAFLMNSCKNIAQKYKTIKGNIDQLADAYSMTYWPSTVQQLIHRTLEHHKDSSNNWDVVNLIRDDLREIKTIDEFLILVHNFDEGDTITSFASVEDQMVCGTYPKRRRACVYKSKTAHNYPVEKLKVLQTAMHEWLIPYQQGNTWYYSMSRFDAAPRILAAMNGLTGMVAVIPQKYKVAYETSMNTTTGFSFGPGWILAARKQGEFKWGIHLQPEDVQFVAGIP